MQIVSRLTEQNLKILELLGEGDSAKRIAGKVHLSKRTVEYHFGALQRLFNCKNNVQLVKRATDYKII
jgi:DNA-binding NarL/FixJ family response regulator